MRASCDPRCSVAFGVLLRPGGVTRHGRCSVSPLCHDSPVVAAFEFARWGANVQAVRLWRRGDHTVHLKRIVHSGDARGMRTCPKCKTPTLAPLAEDRADMPEVVPPSRCTHCQGVWLP